MINVPAPGPKPGQETHIDLPGEIQSRMTVTNNLAMEFVVTTKDKVSDALHEALPRFRESYAWTAPVSITSTVWLTIVTADFKHVLGLTPDGITGGFVVIGILSAGWAVRDLYVMSKRSYKHRDVVDAIIGTHDASASRTIQGRVLDDS